MCVVSRVVVIPATLRRRQTADAAQRGRVRVAAGIAGAERPGAGPDELLESRQPDLERPRQAPAFPGGEEVDDQAGEHRLDQRRLDAAARPAGMPSATRRCSMFARHSAICSARTSPGSPLAVASSAAASMPRRTSARFAGEALIHRHHRRSRSACDRSGWRGEPSVAARPPGPRSPGAARRRPAPPWCRSGARGALTLTPSARGHRAQRHAGEAVLGEVGDDAVEQFAGVARRPGAGPLRLAHPLPGRVEAPAR